MKKLCLLFLSFFILTSLTQAKTIHSKGTLTGSVSNAGVATGGGNWSATSTWLEGTVPLSTDDVIIQSNDLVIVDANANASSLTLQSGAIINQKASVTCTSGGAFTLASGSSWYASYGSATKMPQGFGTYTIDPASNWVFTTAASSSLINAVPSAGSVIYGNVFVYKTGAVLAAATFNSINIQGNLTVNVSGSTLKLTNAKSAQVTTIHVGGNLNIIAGTLVGIDVAFDWTPSTDGQTCIVNVDHNVNVGDASTGSGVAGLASVGSADAGLKRASTFNITGDLSYINGAKFEAGTSGSSTRGDELGIINLSGNLSTDATAVIANNTKGTFVVNFNGTGAQTMTLGVPLAFTPANLFTLKINKTAGDVTLNSSASITGILNLASGNLVLSGNTLAVTTISGGSASSHIAFDAAGTGSVALNVPASTSALLLPVGTSTYYTPLTLQYPVAPTAGVITLSKVTPGMDGVDISALDDAGYTLLRRSEQYWSYSNTAAGSSYTLSIDGSSSQTGIDNNPNLRLIHSADGSTFDLVGTHSDGSGSTAVRTDIPDGTNGRFYLGGWKPTENPLPVELSTFTAANNGRTVLLNWGTKTEKNSNKFDIQRSSFGSADWTVIGSVKASVLSNSPKSYSYSDTKLQSGKYQYRLKMIDNDGTFSYSSVEAAEVAVPKDFAVSQNYPNPFNPSTTIAYQVPVNAKVIMEVYNIAGQKVTELVNQDLSAGYYTANFGASNLSSGVYIYRVVAIDKTTGNNFSSIKKMMLLK